MNVKPDQELYMTEYAAIHIVFTLQGLYTYTHSPRGQPRISRLTPSHQSTVTKLVATDTIVLSRIWDASSRERSGETMKPSTHRSDRILLLGGHRVGPSPPTLILYPPTGLVMCVASSDRIHTHNGEVECTFDIVPSLGPLSRSMLPRRVSSLLVCVSAAMVRDWHSSKV
jgi:hypothetical protein